MFESIQRRIERPLRYFEPLLRDLVNAWQDPISVQSLEGHRLEDEEIEGAREQLCRFAIHVLFS